MNIIKSFIFVLVLAVMALSFTQLTLANQYEGATQPVTILIDKKVSVPNQTITDLRNATYADNLFDFNTRFKPGEDIFFRIKVKNTSNIKLTNVQIKDFFPASFVETIGGAGTLTKIDNRFAVLITVGDLQPDEENVSFIQVRALPANRLPGTGLFCGPQGVVNKATTNADSNAFDDDNAQFCIENPTVTVQQTPQTQVTQTVTVSKGGVPTKIPSAGPEMNIFILSGELLALAAGIYLKKRI